ncbi:rhomboid family intramembrane serine protease [Streptomyces cavernicola]|uniref:Rhomboid family intramembrane serine protease n=1 Tax=Streptomyces cavernicola TaxID=3043613 RepID=A0ABT6S5U0_9ACTN|nr:rhomboid family intramembrane serine protease [Streptomyces sp. B-S-A6]MDI3402788.1 rhomboid family intramembrane serine protease [Streptomyces sp. B-S-A6]
MDQAPGSPQEPQGTSGLPGCYRHPDRETGVRCTRCERPICPECMVSASVGFQCPTCVREGSGTGHAPAANQPRTIAGGAVAADPRLITKILIGLNVAVFVLVSVKPELVSELFLVGGAAYLPWGVASGEWYRLVTSMFLHEEIWHIAFNMLGLWWLGGPLEAALGRVRYVALYLISGLAGSALTYLIASPLQPSLGASGAVFGLMGATAVLMRRLDYDMRPVLALLALNMLFTFTWSGIAWEAHVGGLVAGIAVAYGLVHAPRERRALVQWGTCGLVLLLVLGTVIVRSAQLS